MSGLVQPGRLVGVVVVGTGWGCLTHVPALRASGFRVEALVGTDPARTAARARACGIEGATTNLAEALTAPRVEAVVIATPPESHAELVLSALAAGKHVLCEKPFASRLADAITMHNAAESSGLVHAVGHEMRWYPHHATMAAAIARGDIGQPTFATYVKLSGLLSDPGATVPEWFGSPDRFGGWLNADIQHLVDHIRVSLGEVTAVTASETTATPHPWPVADSFIVQFELACGALAMLQSSIGTFGPPVSVTRVSGTTGTLWTTPTNEVVLATAASEETLPLPNLPDSSPGHEPPNELGVSTWPAHDTTYAEILRGASGHLARPTRHLAIVFRERILGRPAPTNGPAMATFVDGLRNTAVHDAIRRSIKTGCRCVPSN